MQRSTLDLWVGLFVMAGIGALLVLARLVSPSSNQVPLPDLALAMVQHSGRAEPLFPFPRPGF